MKNGLIFFLGLFAALGLSWAGLLLGSNAQLGSLPPYYDDNLSTSFPQRIPGISARGLLVYRDLGCASCHTQQVRRPDFGSDKARGWGDRQSVARDYIYQSFPQLGDSREGPDLTNLAGRKPRALTEEEIYELLYLGHGGMPAYPFLFQKREVTGEVASNAVKIYGAHAPKPGYEIVPTHRAEALASYLQSLNTSYDYPEARAAAAPKKEAK